MLKDFPKRNRAVPGLPWLPNQSRTLSGSITQWSHFFRADSCELKPINVKRAASGRKPRMLRLRIAATRLQTCVESLAMSAVLKQRPSYSMGCDALSIEATTPLALPLGTKDI